MVATIVVSFPSSEGFVTTLTLSELGRRKVVVKSCDKAASTVGIDENLLSELDAIFTVKRRRIWGKPVVVGGRVVVEVVVDMVVGGSVGSSDGAGARVSVVDEVVEVEVEVCVVVLELVVIVDDVDGVEEEMDGEEGGALWDTKDEVEVDDDDGVSVCVSGGGVEEEDDDGCCVVCNEEEADDEIVSLELVINVVEEGAEEPFVDELEGNVVDVELSPSSGVVTLVLLGSDETVAVSLEVLVGV